ncbi:MAG: tail fiber domain-containing protein [Proteobacteria bacterium]|nr:tail fiber domain-containing protein [Pseudomonadota bacterium]
MEIKKRNRSELKSYFIKNAIPTEANFSELVDAMINQRDDGIAKSPGDPLSIEASGDDNSQKKLINFFQTFADDNPSWVISLNPRANPNQPATARVGFSISDGVGNSRLFIDRATGDVGVGTVSPQARLQVQGGAIMPQSGNGNDAGICFPKDPGGGSGDLAWIRHYSRSGENTTFEIGTSNDSQDHIALMASGNVGIGTAEPNHKFHVRAGDAVGLFESTGTHATLRFSTREGINNRVEIANRPGGRLALWTAGAGDCLSITRDGRITLGVSNPVNFTSSWVGTPDRVTNVAEISNDVGSYKTLMIVGNRSAGRTSPGQGRRVSIWDILEVNGNLAVTGESRFHNGLRVDGNLSAHINVDGALYRQSKEVYLTVDNNFYIRDSGSGNTIHFNTDARRLNMRRGMVTFGGSATRGQVMGALGFYGSGIQHGQISFRAGSGFEMVDRSRNGPSLDYALNSHPYADLRVRKLHQISSRAFKENIRDLPAHEAMSALEALEPVQFNYREDPDKHSHLGFIAEDVPELLASPERSHLDAMDIVALLARVVKEQQKTIRSLTGRHGPGPAGRATTDHQNTDPGKAD